MSLSAKLRRAPLRAVTGVYILNSGVGKMGADDDTAKSMHGMATGTYPFLGKVQPKVLAKGLAAGEIAVGTALLLPIVPPIVAGAALAGFSGALLNMYWNTPGMHEEGNPRPTPQGVPVSKDVWLLGIGVGLMADAALEPAHDKVVELEATVSEKRVQKGRRAKRKAAKKASRAAASKRKPHDSDYLKQVRETASGLQAEAAKRSSKAAKKAQKRAEQASEQATKRLAEVRAEYGPVAAEKAKAAREAARNAAEEYGPVAAEKAKAAREAAREFADEYGPIAAEKAKAAREAAREFADEYGPIAAEKAKAARDAARNAAQQATERAHHAMR